MKYEALIKEWCDGLIDRQITGIMDAHLNGGFYCPACKSVHGRGDNAVYPFYYMYSKTGEEKYKKAASLCYSFQSNFLCDDGGVYNDGGNEWRAITVFSCIAYLKTLEHFGPLIEEKSDFEERTQKMTEWVYRNLTPDFSSNINYQCAASLCLALGGKYFGNDSFTKRAREMLDYGLCHFTENGLLFGESHPHDLITPKGCRAIDIGYNVEESVPALAEAAVILQDKKAMDFFADVLYKQLQFMLPDGAWDNSFTCRNYKWTYYGSRTSDGCAGVYMLYSRYNPSFEEAARRNLDLMRNCTADSLLYGGPQYKKAGERPCVHHTFTHAIALVDALILGLKEGSGEIPADKFLPEVKYYPELDSYKICTGEFIADFSCYDIGKNAFGAGRGYATGGSMSLLYHKKKGLITASSLYKYTLAEPFNQQLTLKTSRYANLTPRVERIVGKEVYTSCLDTSADIEIIGNTVRVKTALLSAGLKKQGETELVYSFNKNRLNIKITGEDIKYILPVIGQATVESNNKFKKREIFNFIPGFLAQEYVFENSGGQIEVDITV